MSVGPSPSRRLRLALPAWIALGLAARVALAIAESGTVDAAEADGFVRAWIGWQRGDLNRMRPPGWSSLLDALGGASGRGSVLGLRLACVALSLAALGAGLLLVRTLTRPGQRPSASRWLAAAWALSPMLLEAGVRPVGATAVAAVVALALAAVIGWYAHPSWPRWLGLVASLALAVLVGGTPVALAALLTLVVYVIPLPPARRTAPLLAAVLIAAVGVWFAGRAGPGRPFLPEGSVGESLLELTRAPSTPTLGRVVHPDRRLELALRAGLLAAQDAGPAACARWLAARCVADLLGPSRWQTPARAAVTGLDVLLFAGAAAGAWRTLRRARRVDEAGWPRAALGAGLVVLLLGLAATACDPWALAPVAFALAACAAPALAGGGWARALPVAAIAAILLGALAPHVMPHGWTWMTPRDPTEGPGLVTFLRDGGPRDVTDRLRCAALMTDPAAPFLRLPEAAVRQSQASLLVAPDDPLVLLAAARSHAEALDFVGARELASSLVGDDGLPLPEARVTLDTIDVIERRLRDEQLR